MSFDTNWDIAKYEDDTEYDLHWELRKSFMETHKNKYPEGRLVALSKTFANMEFMGCVYNSELMLLVRNLAKQVDAIVQYKENKKSKISRTFVKASDAVKMNKKPAEFLNKNEKNNRNEKRKLEFVHGREPDDSIFEHKRLKPNNISTRKITNEDDWQLFQKVKAQRGVKGKLIIYTTNDLSLVEKKQKKTILHTSASKCQIVFKFNVEKLTENPKMNKLQLKLDEEVVAEIDTEKVTHEIKDDLVSNALEYLQKYCFTVIPNNEYEKVNKKATETTAGLAKESADPTAMHSGVGAKIMKLMGWKGEGLGKNESGIQAPIEATLHVRKVGLGAITRTDKAFGNTIKKYLINYLESDEKRPLQFTAEFTKEERMKIHSIAQRMPLKTQSYGKGDQRAIRIEKKFNHWDLIEELLAHGGSTVSHTLIKPTAFL